MKQITKYKCETCNQEFYNRTDCEVHEAKHFGLTGAEFLEWRNRCRNAASAGKMLAVSTNKNSRKIFDQLIAGLCDFEEQYDLKYRKRPSDFYI